MKYWNRWSIKLRWKVLIFFFLLLIILSFRFNVSRTIGVVKSYHELKVEVSKGHTPLATSAHKGIGYSRESLREHSDAPFLDFINNYCEGHEISVVEINQSNYLGIRNYRVEANKVILRGRYETLLRLLSEIERNNGGTTINSALFEMKREDGQDIYALYATVFVKQLNYEKK